MSEALNPTWAPGMPMGNSRTRVLLTLLHLHQMNGRTTMREVAAGAGLSLTNTHRHLDHLAAEGLVAWEPGTGGSLRPLVRAEAL